MIHNKFKNDNDNEFFGTIILIIGLCLIGSGNSIGLLLFIIGCFLI